MHWLFIQGTEPSSVLILYNPCSFVYALKNQIKIWHVKLSFKPYYTGMVSGPYWGMPRLSNFKKLNRVMENIILKYFTKIRNNRYLGNFVVLTQKMKCALQFLHLLEEVKALHWCDLHLKHKAPKERNCKHEDKSISLL